MTLIKLYLVVLLQIIIANSLICQFREVSQNIGINHLTISFDLIGGGVAFFDYNNDGWEDLLVTGGAEQDRLFRNLGNGTFLNVTHYVGLDNTSIFKTTGVVTGDINNDGFRDILIGTERQDAPLIYLNDNGERFRNISSSSLINTRSWTIGASMIDVNLDGWLDVYLINYIEKSRPMINEAGETIGFDHDCYPNNLFINNQDNTFYDASQEYGVQDIGCALAVAGTDVNADGISDLLIANDFGEWVEPNKAYLNEYPTSGFSENGSALGLNYGIFGMGIAIGDINADGLLDYYISNLGKNILHINETTHFSDQTDLYGVGIEKFNGLNSTSWGTVITDLNNDGFEDLLVSNGYIPSSPFIATTEIDPNKVFINHRGLELIDFSENYHFSDSGISRGMAVADFDLDGDMDVAVTKLEKIRDSPGNMLFYVNDAENDHHWVKVKLKGTDSNRDAFGSRISLRAGDRLFVEEVLGGSSHVSQNSSVAHFGLGHIDAPIYGTVLWPNGAKQDFTLPETHKTYLIEEGVEEIYVLGCMDEKSSNYSPGANVNFACVNERVGCMDPRASNYDPEAGLPGACRYAEEQQGCMDTLALNYDPEAIIDNGTCRYTVTGVGQGPRLLIYPTSSNGSFTLQSEVIVHEIAVISLSGKTVYHSPVAAHHCEISIPGLHQGLYVVVLTTEHQKLVRKVQIVE